MSSVDLNQRFDELIRFGKTLLPFQGNDLEYLAKKGKWEAQCQALLERTFGQDSIYFSKFRSILNHTTKEAHVTLGIALMEGAKEELDLEKKSSKLDEIKGEIEEEKAEAERRAAVVETKLWGSVIEVIDMLREELKRRHQVESQMNQAMTKKDQEIADLKDVVENMRQEIERRVNAGPPTPEEVAEFEAEMRAWFKKQEARIDKLIAERAT